jgi:hypothetical protein
VRQLDPSLRIRGAQNQKEIESEESHPGFGIGDCPFGVSACSDSGTDSTTTQSTQPSAAADQQQQTGTSGASGSNGAQTTETIQNRPASGTGGDAPGGATGN